MQIPHATTLTPTGPPVIPPSWVWTCHRCHSSFPLGATRRCLNDGHYLCAGTTSISPRTGRVRRHKPCGSVFDYTGWQDFGDWRRKETRRLRTSFGVPHSGGLTLHRISRKAFTESITPHKVHNCFTDCNYPSECRWKIKVDREGSSSQASGEPCATINGQSTEPSIGRAHSRSAGAISAMNLHSGVSAPQDTLRNPRNASDTLTIGSPKDPRDESPSPDLLELDPWPKPPRASSLGILAKSADLLRGLLQVASADYTCTEHGQSVAAAGTEPWLGLDLDSDQAAMALSPRGCTSSRSSSDVNSTSNSFSKIWDWSIGGLNGFRQRDIGLSGEMLEEA